MVNRYEHTLTLVFVGLLTIVVLVMTVSSQIYDSNLYAMTGAISILAGDHPYRDVFDPGIPLSAYTAALAQVLSGNRLVGEFLRQWLFIVAGMVVAFHVGLKLSGSVRATLAMLPIALLLLATTPTYHFSKLLFFPLAIWLSWRYVERPGTWRGAALGATTAVAFLFRHDYGIYLGAASMLAFVLGRVCVPASRAVKSMAGDAAAFATVVAVLLLPWAIAVQTSEGLADYARSRATLFQRAPAVASILDINPLTLLLPEPPPPPRRGTVSFVWLDTVDDERRRQLEGQYRLRRIGGPDAAGRLEYEAADVNDSRFLDLLPSIDDALGFDWQRLTRLYYRLPSRVNAFRWLQWMALFVAGVLLVGGVLGLARRPASAPSRPRRAGWMVAAGGFLLVVDAALFREPAYVAVVAPVTAALGASFLVARPLVVRAVTVALMLLTTYASWVTARESVMFLPLRESAVSVPATFSRLMALPPRYDVWFDYIRDCTRPDDRVLVTGSTPLHVSYYSGRPIAGGHINWRHGWRADPAGEAQSLALLHRQSVPIIISTNDPGLTDFQRYPRIHEYLSTYYRELDGTGGRLMVDTRRMPTGRFAATGFPCFR